MEDNAIDAMIHWLHSVVDWILPDATLLRVATHFFVLCWTLLMIVFSSRLFAMIENTSSTMTRVNIFRSLNVLVIVCIAFDLVLLRFHQNYGPTFKHIGLSILTIYTSIYLYSLASFHIFKRFGTPKKIDNKEVFVETYSTRIINLLLVAVMAFSAFYIIIKIWGADSLLETTGLMGIFVGFLAFTAPVWAPDIISGLIILNSQILDDGDVVVIDGFPNEYIISKVSFVYVTLYDIQNNHRALVKNSRFLQSKIDNLSRIASTDGLRTKLTYKIGYPRFEGANSTDRLEALERFLKRVDNMFQRAFELCNEDNSIQVNETKPFQWALTQTGDFALEFTMWFYFKKIPNTKVTATARKHLMGTLYSVNLAVYKASIHENLDLSTPAIANLSFSEKLNISSERAVEPTSEEPPAKHAPDNIA